MEGLELCVDIWCESFPAQNTQGQGQDLGSQGCLLSRWRSSITLLTLIVAAQRYQKAS